jgi:hypothetical protein
MGTAQVAFAVEQCGGATGSDLSHVTGNEHVRKYVLRMHNRKLRHIRPSGDL